MEALAVKSDFYKFIFPALCIIFVLTFSGVLLIYSSTEGNLYDFDAMNMALRQTLFVFAGFVIIEGMRRIKSEKYLKAAPYLFVISLIVLWSLLFFGVRINGMRGWFACGIFLIQPSEIFKFVYILFICFLYMTIKNKEKAFCIGGAATLLWAGAVIMQPDYGTAMLYCAAFALISFLAGVKWCMLWLLPLAAVSSLIFFIAKKEYGFKRLYGFFSENADVFGSAWHWKQFQLTVARGGWLGKRIEGAFWSNNYLPFAYNDSAYAAMHETIGWIGASLILVFFFVLLYLFYRYSAGCGEKRVLVLSGIFIILMQVLVHCSINCALVPTTGLTMPFISYGGSSLVGTFMIIGMLFSFCNAGRIEE